MTAARRAARRPSAAGHARAPSRCGVNGVRDPERPRLGGRRRTTVTPPSPSQPASDAPSRRTVVVPRSATPSSEPRSMIRGGTSVMATSRPPRACAGSGAVSTVERSRVRSGRAPRARNEPSGCSTVARYETSAGADREPQRRPAEPRRRGARSARPAPRRRRARSCSCPSRRARAASRRIAAPGTPEHRDAGDRRRRPRARRAAEDRDTRPRRRESRRTATSGAARSTGTSARRSSRTTTSAGTA